MVKKYQGNKRVKTFKCWNHLLVMIFAQLTKRESLRDLIAVLDAHQGKLQHLCFGDSVTRSNLSKANETRDARIFEKFAYILIKTARDKRSSIDRDIYDVLRVLELSMFDKSPIVELFKKKQTQVSSEEAIQLSLKID